MIVRALVKSSLLLGVAALWPVAGQAQTPATAEPEAAAPDADGAEAGAVVVTGTRIRRPDFAAPNPIVSLDAANIRQSGNTNVTDFLTRVPALTNSRDSTRTAGRSQADGASGEVGLNLLDLRGLGPERTLVLVNGRRHVAGQINTAAVDINAIPTDLIERIDVLTGGASAIYGADGVSGAVNFILKRDFDGFAARGQAGISSRGDAGNRFASLVAGRNFADDRANLTLAYEYSADDPLANDDRRYLSAAERQFFVNLDNYDPARPSSFQKGPLGDLRYPYSSNQGIVYIGSQTFRGDGVPYTFGRFLQNDGFTVGGDDTPVAGYIGDIFPRSRRHAVNALARFDASDAFKLSLEGKFVQTKVSTLSGFGGDYPSEISFDNPFIPQTIRNAALANGDTAVFVNRNNLDFPRRGEADRRRTWRGVIDASGRISDHASYDVYYTYGRTDVRATKLNDRLDTRYREALDAIRLPNGQVGCRSASARAAGCVPVNLFGGNTVDPAAFAYFLAQPVNDARIDQHVVNASLTGDFGAFFELPGGPLQFAVGGEYRRESSRFDPDPLLVGNAFYQFDEYILPTPSRGRFDVWEAFGELNAPLLKDRRFAHLLSVGAAGRYSDYSTVGGTRAYQFNGIYAPVADLSIRGSYGRSVRAPNIGEIFRPLTGTSNFFSDPCYLTNRGNGTQFRDANCRALIARNGGNQATFTAANNPDAFIFIPGSVEGNPDLRAEVARTWTAGAVLRPRFVPGLSIAADWYDIRIRDAIISPDPNNYANACVDQPTLDNLFCPQVVRATGTGYIQSYAISFQNVSVFRTAGLEVNASYRIDTGNAGRFDLRLVGNYLHRLEQVATPGAVVEDNRDQIFRPKYAATFSPSWTREALTLAYTLRWQNGTRRFAKIDTDRNPSFVDPRYFRYKALWQHDVQGELRVDDRFALYGGVNNLADRKPDIGFETNVPISPLGRYFYAGVRIGGR